MPPPIFKIDIKKATRALERDIDEFRRKQIPYARVLAANEIGVAVLADIKAGIQKSFDRPTQWTMNAFYLKKATKADPTAFIGIREFAGKGGTPAWKYLTPETDSGARNMKRFERALSSLSGGQFAVSTSKTPLDQYGNMSRGAITQMLSQLNAFGEQGYKANMSAETQAKLTARGKVARFGSRKRIVIGHNKKGEPIYGRTGPDNRRSAGGQYFIAKGRMNGRPLGVYKLTGSGKGSARVQPIVLFKASAPTYKARFNFDNIVMQSVAKNQVGAFERAMAKALETAK